MRSFYRLFRATALAGLAVLPVACGSATNPNTGGSSGPVTLQVWANGDEGDKLAASDVIANYKKANPNVTLQITPLPWSVAHDKLITSIAGRSTPDVAMIGTTWMGELTKLNAVTNLPSSFNKGDYFGMDTATANGNAYGVPWYVETRVLYYRKDLAAAAGVTSAPATWDDLTAMAQKLKAAGHKYGINFQTNDWQEFVPFIWSAGGDVMKNGKFTLDSPEAVKALTFYSDFFKKGLSRGTTPQGFDLIQAFVAGDDPAFVSGPWMAGLITKAGLDQSKWAVAPMPKGDKSATSFVGGSDWVVFKNSKNPDAAWKFVQFMMQKDSQVAWYKDLNDLPALKDGWSDSALTADPNLKVFGGQLKDAKSAPNIAQWEEVAKAIDDWEEKAALNKVTPQDAAKGMQQQATQIVGG
ncbi:MAG: sugar ABC transporter substrate-binding protein [Candidatus Dormibacteraeota bacterium]|nr:sugar ABC transporter substrate-binding protein [Candidatus Dormibacteraeota bacterium]